MQYFNFHRIQSVRIVTNPFGASRSSAQVGVIHRPPETIAQYIFVKITLQT